MSNSTMNKEFDVIVVGAGFAGLYMLHKLRQQDMSVKVLESAGGVGGTWYWNRYPGARCDIISIDYSYSFDANLQKEWQWKERYATQPEILAYLNHVAERFDLYRDIQFDTKVTAARWDEDIARWHITTNEGVTLRCRHYIMASGCLSVPKEVEFDGLNQFAGEVYMTGRWPHETVDFTGKRVGVIGTGSTGIQVIPEIAKQASAVTVFQRTPNFSIPAHNGPLAADLIAEFERDPQAYREAARNSSIGVPGEMSQDSAMAVSEEERQKRYKKMWQEGTLFGLFSAFGDVIFNPLSNEAAANFVRDKIRATVKNPETAATLCPTDYPFLTKRPCLDSGYFETFNQAHVNLVDLGKDPIQGITSAGIKTASGEHTFDALVFATGFDAMTGAIVNVNIRGRAGITLADEWLSGPKTYMGLTVAGFPNFFMITGPGSPSVLSNMMVSIEQHVEWIADCLKYMADNDYQTIEATPTAETAWGIHVNDAANLTLYPQANSWYMGANVPGKPRMFLPFIGGVGAYRRACNDIVAGGYLGFHLKGAGGETRNDGIVRPFRPDVQMVLEILGGAGLPPLESLDAEGLRSVMAGLREQSPPGPEVGAIVDGTYAGAAGDLAYRLYRPATEGPHAVVLYFHGGGWVIGSHDSDDPFCRDLCVKSNALIVSCDYRHAPETRFPGAVEDAVAALNWISTQAKSLGGIPGKLAVMGWSAGGNLAAVVAQHARDHGGPTLAGQVLITPVTDSDFSRPSYEQHALGPVLSSELMFKFWDAYTNPADRSDPRVAPMRASNLLHLPPALVVTSQFDPLHDEGVAYAEAMANAGVAVRSLDCRGHIHTSFSMVDMVLSGAEVRTEMASALKGFFDGQRMTYTTSCWR